MANSKKTAPAKKSAPAKAAPSKAAPSKAAVHIAPKAAAPKTAPATTTPAATANSTVADSDEAPKKKNHILHMMENLDSNAMAIQSINTIISDLQAVKSQINSRDKKITSIHERVKKFIDKKTQTKNSRVGFMKPCRISLQLCQYLNLPADTMINRPDLSKKLSAQIKANKLVDPKDAKRILPDAKLKDLLQCKDEEVRYFNIQRFLKHHFIKDEAK